jgi:hypothetical protein
MSGDIATANLFATPTRRAPCCLNSGVPLQPEEPLLQCPRYRNRATSAPAGPWPGTVLPYTLASSPKAGPCLNPSSAIVIVGAATAPT